MIDGNDLKFEIDKMADAEKKMHQKQCIVFITCDFWTCKYMFVITYEQKLANYIHC